MCSCTDCQNDDDDNKDDDENSFDSEDDVIWIKYSIV